MGDHFRRIFGSPFRKETDLVGHHAQTIVAEPPDAAGFYNGREFRTWYEMNIPTGQSQVIRVIVPVDLIFKSLGIEPITSDLDVESVVGGTEGGTFSTALPIIPVNTMSTVPTPVYQSQLSISTGGTHTDGQILDKLMFRQTGQGANVNPPVDRDQEGVRGVGADTYYFRLINVNSEAVTGIFRARWEERP